MNNEQNSEEKILEAAEKIFMRDGYDGARMQAIADEAGINKALLHYYFRSKDMLFEKIFAKKVAIFFPNITDIMTDKNSTFIEKMSGFVEKYIQLLRQYPYLPLFVISTINKSNNQSFIKGFPFEVYRHVMGAYVEAVAKGEVRQVNIIQFMLSVMGMCAFPFIGKPLVKALIQIDDNQYDQLMEHRIKEVQSYIRILLQP